VLRLVLDGLSFVKLIINCTLALSGRASKFL
jgi:hypothetical protein